MADSSDSQTSVETDSEVYTREELDELKRDLEGWREAFLPLRSLLLWERRYYPAVIFGVTTFVFALIWLLEPSVLTTFAVLGLMTIGVDFILPFVSPYLFSSMHWTIHEEQQFEDTCERILYFRTHVFKFIHGMSILKQERPKIYFILVMGTLATFAWIGHLMNNLYLSYFIVLTILMIPGLKQTAVVQQLIMKYWQMFKNVLFGRLETMKRKMK